MRYRRKRKMRKKKRKRRKKRKYTREVRGGVDGLKRKGRGERWKLRGGDKGEDERWQW